MSTINYKITHYEADDENLGVAKLYKKVFGITYENGLPKEFKKNPCGIPVGVVAMNERAEVVGHFATMATQANMDGVWIPGRISFGFMVDSEYQGCGIGKNLANVLFKYLAEENCAFIIGFPNENSMYMHLKYMGYVHVRDYHMTIIPNKELRVPQDEFKRLETIDCEVKEYCSNMMIHSKEVLQWKFGTENYMKFEDSLGNLFVCNYYHDTLQILFWSLSVTKKQLEKFACFIYKEYGVTAIRTWDVFKWQDSYNKEKRAFRFTIKWLDERYRDVNTPNRWFFYPCDCELF